MNTFSVRNVLATVSVASALMLGSPAVMADSHGAAECGKTELASQMKEMKKHLKGYKQASKSGDWTVMSEHRTELQRLTVAGQSEVPYKAHDKSEAEKQEMTENYKKGMEKLEGLLNQLAEAEAAKDADQVKQLMKQLGAQSKKGHKAFKLKCDKD